ncbi:hypothetical protein NDU88_008163, partial [Pleurodeles waltl]
RQHQQRMLTSLPASPSVSSLLQRRKDPLSVCAVIFIFRPSQTPPRPQICTCPPPAPGGGESLEMSAQVSAQ